MQHKQENKLHATGPPSWADDTIRQSLRLHGMIQTGLALLKPTVMYGEWVSHANRARTCLFFFFSWKIFSVTQQTPMTVRATDSVFIQFVSRLSCIEDTPAGTAKHMTTYKKNAYWFLHLIERGGIN